VRDVNTALASARGTGPVSEAAPASQTAPPRAGSAPDTGSDENPLEGDADAAESTESEESEEN
jgi:hypothetical protein